jgi:hypothetical protein
MKYFRKIHGKNFMKKSVRWNFPWNFVISWNFIEFGFDREGLIGHILKELGTRRH